MKRLFPFVVVAGVTLAVVIPFGISSPKKPVNGLTVKAIPVRILDGDTLEVEVRFRITVRLLECWAPETRTLNLEEKALGEESKKYLQEMLEDDEEITLFIPSKDSNIGKMFTFGRVLGYIWDDDSSDSINSRMVAAGKATATK